MLATPDVCLVHAGCEAGVGAGSVAVIEGFLSNATELAETMHVAPNTGSGQLLALAFDRWGDRAAARLQGEFAAAIYDTKACRAFLVRDHIGTRPLYWHYQRGIISFSTLMADLLSLLAERPPPDEESIASFLRSPAVLGPHTLLKDVKSLEPGCILTIDAQGPRACRWWRPEEAQDVRFRRVEDYASAGRELVERAVASRLPVRKTIGSHLSGGLDSTVVTLIAQERLRARGDALTGVYSWSPPISSDAPEMDARDERRRVLSICADAGLSPRFGSLDGADLRRFLARPIELEGLADVADELAILKQAQTDGVAVMLSGWGGDEAFSAHAHGVPAWLLLKGRLLQVGRLARANAGLRRPHMTMKYLWDYAVLPSLPDSFFRRFGPYADIHGKGAYLSPSLRALTLQHRPEASGRFTADPTADIRNALLRGHIGERMATWTAWGTLFGVEYRYPLTDRGLLDYVLGLPPDILWGDRSSRFLARDTLTGRVRVRPLKSDPANERKRLGALRDCWSLLSQDVAKGLFNGECPWLDMPRLRQNLLRGPSGNDRRDALAFVCIMPAIRIWHMAERYGINQPARIGRS